MAATLLSKPAMINYTGALFADGLQAGQARDTREMVKTVGSMATGRWAWEMSRVEIGKLINKPVGIFSTPGINFEGIGMQTLVQGGVGYIACIAVGMPRTFQRSIMDAFVGTVAESTLGRAAISGGTTPA